MEFISGGDLMFHIQRQGRFGEIATAFYGAEILEGLWFLHDRGIVHRDLKLDNVMLDQDGHIKITDMGMCKEGMLPDQTTGTFCGTPDYIAPEIIHGMPYNKSVDFWALGVLLYEMLIGRPPFDGADDDELFDNVIAKDIRIPSGVPTAAASLLRGLMQKRPSSRLGCGPSGRRDIMDHPFYRHMDWDKLKARQVKPPFKPPSSRDPTANFDREFTREKVHLTPIPKAAIKDIDQKAFADFDFAVPQ
ncbi:AGC/PKC/ALPHA protein kinase [Salpingoeca rosetta]|uniref:AGC/PKC/ALPHA protein kinase n=1 Tax=Salpingoeca rosetta (strain ATCC 50818 / BSB-021) TaxID=946362 RepID=F2UQ35_SALR5|nr:AGC/PKC/ALPHA protein kinase [Salpingoeca rosetta]EGD79703.1 AGC/PKC/ALPHA protein kinase [Salpingoeca rosetta]|eukprot:XP_004988653.1 AGC/PKC/ALPHA protein kinase [Salpingoeca rosetta]